MQYAKCTLDNKNWEAAEFERLPTGELETKRTSLVCTECGEFAWYRKRSIHGNPPHFCAHHAEGCDLKVEYVSSTENRDDVTETADEVANNDTIIVRLDKEKGGAIDVVQVQAPPISGQGEGGRRYVITDNTRLSSQQFTLRRILHRLVKSEAFRKSASRIIFYRTNDDVMLDGQVKDIVISFADITKEKHHDKINFYWGPIVSVKKTADGKIWLNSRMSYNSASVAIFEDIADDFMQFFEVDELDDLLGAYVLVAGRCSYSNGGEGKPIIWCGTKNYIFVKKYKDPYIEDVE